MYLIISVVRHDEDAYTSSLGWVAIADGCWAAQNALIRDWPWVPWFAGLAVAYAAWWWRRRKRRKRKSALSLLGEKSRALLRALLGRLREQARAPRGRLAPVPG